MQNDIRLLTSKEVAHSFRLYEATHSLWYATSAGLTWTIFAGNPRHHSEYVADPNPGKKSVGKTLADWELAGKGTVRGNIHREEIGSLQRLPKTFINLAVNAGRAVDCEAACGALMRDMKPSAPSAVLHSRVVNACAERLDKLFDVELGGVVCD